MKRCYDCWYYHSIGLVGFIIKGLSYNNCGTCYKKKIGVKNDFYCRSFKAMKI